MFNNERMLLDECSNIDFNYYSNIIHFIDSLDRKIKNLKEMTEIIAVKFICFLYINLSLKKCLAVYYTACWKFKKCNDYPIFYEIISNNMIIIRIQYSL